MCKEGKPESLGKQYRQLVVSDTTSNILWLRKVENKEIAKMFKTDQTERGKNFNIKAVLISNQAEVGSEAITQDKEGHFYNTRCNKV